MLERSLGNLGPLTSLVCGVLTIGTFAYVYSMQLQATAAAGRANLWPTCAGTVESVSKERAGTTEVSYDYRVTGKTYHSFRVYYDQLSSGTKLAEGEYTAGQPVNVHYDPQDPQESILRLGTAGAKGNEAIYVSGVILGLGLLNAGIAKTFAKKQSSAY